jgi:predicted metal-dependent phosphoesterase TrpH
VSDDDGGGFRVDLHVKVLDGRVAERAKRRGLDALVYAPHFVRLPEIRATAERYTDDELLVVPAREVFTGDWSDRKHVLAVGLEEPVPDFVTLEAAMSEFERQDAAVLVPHPEFATVSLGADDLERYRDVVDAVEVYNPKHFPSRNRRARDLAAETGLPPFASSYAHLRGTVGEAWTTFETRFGAPSDLVGALREGAPRRVFHQSGAGHRLRCRLEFAHLFYENSLSKAHLLARGVKPTNPHPPAYGGRFDDVAAYDEPWVRSFRS